MHGIVQGFPCSRRRAGRGRAGAAGRAVCAGAAHLLGPAERELKPVACALSNSKFPGGTREGVEAGRNCKSARSLDASCPLHSEPTGAMVRLGSLGAPTVTANKFQLCSRARTHATSACLPIATALPAPIAAHHRPSGSSPSLLSAGKCRRVLLRHSRAASEPGGHSPAVGQGLRRAVQPGRRAQAGGPTAARGCGGVPAACVRPAQHAATAVVLCSSSEK